MKAKEIGKQPSLRGYGYGLKKALCIAAFTVVAACGGSGGGGGNVSEIIGTGFSGTTAVGAPLASKNVSIRSATGVTTSTVTDSAGEFSSNEIFEATADTPRGPYLLRVDEGSQNYLYSIAHSENAESLGEESEEITVNVHPYTNLIIRNWFAQQGQNIDDLFDSGNAISLPSLAEIEDISAEFIGILNNAIAANEVIGELDLISTPFAADGTGFDSFLDNSQVNIIDNSITVIVNQPVVNAPIHGPLISDVPLDYDFTDSNDSAPSAPESLRALPTDVEGEVVLVWNPSSDDKGVAGYNVYRDAVLVETTPFPVFIDSGLSNSMNFTYTVEAVDGRGQVSDLSSMAEITLDAPDETAPPEATNVVVLPQGSTLAMSWDQSDIDDVSGFRVLRGGSGNANTEVVNITSTNYVDFDVVAGTEYCYRIVTYDAAGNESLATDEVCATASGAATGASSVSFSSAVYSAEESSPTATIFVSRAGDLSGAISVDYAVVAGTAEAGVDFVEASGTLTWSAAESADKSFSVQLTENSEVESDETVLLSLESPVGTSIATPGDAVLTITDAPQVTCVDLTPVDITVNTTFDLPCYNVNSSIEVSNAATLTIEPGTTLIFAQGTQLGVENDGVLLALGTEQDPITFTGEIATAGYWDGLEIESLATSQLDYVLVEYGGGSSFNEANVGISFDGRLSITNSTIRSSASYGVSVSSTNGEQLVAFSGNIVTLNELSPVHIVADQVGVIESNNQLSGNVTLAGGDRDFIRVDSGSNVNSEQTWSFTGLPYRFSGSSTDINAALTLSPGMVLEFGSGIRLNISDTGTLIADGTAGAPITFTGIQKTPGYWDGIQFTFNNTANLMNHTIVEYGGGDSNVNANVGVFGSDGRLTIRNSILRESELNGFYFDDRIDLVMENVTSTNNGRPGFFDNPDDIGLLDGASVYAGNDDDRIVVSGGDIFTSQTIKKLDVPYYFSSGSNVDITDSLTIEPGVEIQFASNGGLDIREQGTLTAVGTPADPIVFTGAQQTKGFWNGLQFTFSNNPNVIDYAVFEFGGAESGNVEALVGFFGGVGSPNQGTVTNSVFRSSLTNGIELSLGTTGDFSTGNTFEDIDGEDILDPR